MYQEFAYVYDELMDNIPYEQWCENLCQLLEREGITDGLLCELGCGTGIMTELLASAGYDMIGIDVSADMLEVAREKLYDLEWEEEPPILYLEQDMRSFELYGTVRAVISVCDSMNYLMSEADVLQVLRLTSNYLDPQGVFLFDMKTPHFYETLGNRTISEVRDDVAMIWDNEYEAETMTNRYQLTLFTQEEDEKYSRSEEFHEQRAYALDTVKRLIEEAGLAFVEVLDAETLQPVTPTTDRWLFVAREQHHDGKMYI